MFETTTLTSFIGSQAIKILFPDFREPQDRDFLIPSHMEKPGNFMGCEFYQIPALDYVALSGRNLNADELLTLKMSHLFWDINWEKHIMDVTFLKSKGAKIIDHLFEELYQFWCDTHGTPRRADLSLTKDEFFDNAIMKYGELEHDDLHKIINPIPTYTKILIEPNGVEVSEEKYNLLTHQERLELVREECYVMAYERLSGRRWQSSYKWMVKQMVLKHAPWYEALFIINNYDELKKPVYNFKEKLDYEISRDK